MVLSIGDDDRLRIWKFPEGHQVASIECGAILDVVMFPDGDSLAWLCWDGIYLSKISKLADKVLLTKKRTLPKGVEDTVPVITGISVSSDNDQFAYIDEFAHLQILSLSSRKVKYVDGGKKDGLVGRIHVVLFSPSGKLLAFSNCNNEVEILSVDGFSRYRSIRSLEGNVRHLSFSLDDKYISVAFENNVAKVYEVSSAKEVRSYNDTVFAEFSPLSNKLAISNRTGNVKIVDLATRAEQEYRFRVRVVHSISWQTNGNVIQLSSSDARIRFYDIIERRELFKGNDPTDVD